MIDLIITKNSDVIILAIAIQPLKVSVVQQVDWLMD